METNFTNILCSNHRDQSGFCSDCNDVICLGDNQLKKKTRCNKIVDCLYREDEYWCGPDSLRDQITYLISKKETIIASTVSIAISSKVQSLNSIFNTQNDNFSIIYSYRCNRGLSIIEMNESRCLHSPIYSNCYLDYHFNGEVFYECNCLSRFYENKYQNIRSSIRIQLNMTSKLSARATVIHFVCL
jgi:hypothetical protein